MSLHDNPGHGPALMCALHQHRARQLQDASEARQRHRLVEATGINPETLPAQAQRTLAWLSGWDTPTIDGLVEILLAVRTAAQIAVHQEAVDGKVTALRESEAATEAALARYDEKEAQRHGRG
jgi:hypothetical protein